MHWFYLLIAIFFEVCGTSILKITQNFTVLVPTIVALACYFFCFYTFSISIKTIPMGPAYSIWCGLGAIFLSLVGYLFFKEKLDFYAILGIILILFGVAIIKLFSANINDN